MKMRRPCTHRKKIEASFTSCEKSLYSGGYRSITPPTYALRLNVSIWTTIVACRNVPDGHDRGPPYFYVLYIKVFWIMKIFYIIINQIDLFDSIFTSHVLLYFLIYNTTIYKSLSHITTYWHFLKGGMVSTGLSLIISWFKASSTRTKLPWLWKQQNHFLIFT